MTPRALIGPGRLAGVALLRCQSDERLVDLTRAGSERAFEAIVARYRQPLLRYCRRLLPADGAEDVLQQSLASAYRSLLSGDEAVQLRPWLYRIVHNGCVSALRRRASGAEVPDDLGAPERVEDTVEDRERLREVISAIGELPESQRHALLLRTLEGRSHDEIAAQLGVSGGAARQLLHRARTSLRAAATAVTPTGFLPRLFAEPGERATLELPRLAELVASAGGTAVAAKVCVGAAVVAGAAGGVVAPRLAEGGDGKAALTGASAGRIAGPLARDGIGLAGPAPRSGDASPGERAGERSGSGGPEAGSRGGRAGSDDKEGGRSADGSSGRGGSPGAGGGSGSGGAGSGSGSASPGGSSSHGGGSRSGSPGASRGGSSGSGGGGSSGPGGSHDDDSDRDDDDHGSGDHGDGDDSGDGGGSGDGEGDSSEDDHDDSRSGDTSSSSHGDSDDDDRDPPDHRSDD